MPDATIVITTKDRRDDLRVALASAVAQRGADIEVLVIDDGSSDGTGAMVRGEFPAVRVESRARGGGYIRARNLAARLASGRVIVSIDDDAELTAPDIVARVLRGFDHPRVAAIAMPHLHTRMSAAVIDVAPDAESVWCGWTFIGTAHALRRDAFLEVGGYREALGTRVEEPDLCLRLLDRGLVCRLGSTAPILHHESTSRDRAEIDRQTARNELLEAWRTVPGPALPRRLAEVTANMVRLGLGSRSPGPRLLGLAQGAGAIARSPGRRPVAPGTWRATRILMRERAVRLERIEPLLAAPA